MNDNARQIDPVTYLVTPYARKILFLFGISSSLYLLIIVALNMSSLLWYGLIISFFGMIVLHYFTGKHRKYYTPLIFVLLFFIGYILDLANVIGNLDKVPITGWYGIGTFSFTHYEFLQILTVILFGWTGIALGTLLAERLYLSFNAKSGFLVHGSNIFKISNLKIWTWLWFIFSITLIIILLFLGIGRTGLIHETELPFRISGFLNYVKGVLLPAIGFFLLISSSTQGQYKTVKTIFWLSLIIGFIASITSLSRGLLAFTIFPGSLFLILNAEKRDKNVNLAFQFIGITIALLILIIVLVEEARTIAYQHGYYSIHILPSISLKEDPNFNELISNLFIHITSRIGGNRELMAIISAQISELYAPWLHFISYQGFVDSLYMRALNISPQTMEYQKFGFSFGLWGTLYTSGSYFVIFLGSMLYSLISIGTELLFIRKNLKPMALFFAIFMCLHIWSFLYLSVLIKDVLMTLITYCSIVLLSKSIYQYRLAQ